LTFPGASDNSVDLLPNPALGSWTKELPTDDGLESDQIFAFDGKTTAIEIPSDKLDFSLGNTFTVSTWMKHSEEEADEKTESHGDPKEHIMCHSDGEGELHNN
jgi:calsyntenin 1